ncbi:hypothetical protein D3C87_1459570 [compost metagenome]
MSRNPEPGGNLFRVPSAIVRKLAEPLELIGGVHGFAGDVLVKADFRRVVLGIQNAADGFGLLDLLALNPQQLRQPPAFADGHKIASGRLAFRVRLRLHHQILQHSLGADAGGQSLDVGFAVRGLAGVLGRPLQLVQGHVQHRAVFDGGGFGNCGGRFDGVSHGLDPHWLGLERSAALQPWPSPRPGGARGKGGRAGGGSPGLHGTAERRGGRLGIPARPSVSDPLRRARGQRPQATRPA